MAAVVQFRRQMSGAVIEKGPFPDPAGHRDTGPEDQRVRQQELLTALGLLALKGTPFPELLEHTARLTAEGLRTEFCKVL